MLEIEDDGRGFDPEAVRGGGRGLANLRERVTTAGGEFAIRSTSGEGTTLTLRFPA
jgi:signal transduction histidine kinase